VTCLVVNYILLILIPIDDGGIDGMSLFCSGELFLLLEE
jgi:hypothetical protein